MSSMPTGVFNDPDRELAWKHADGLRSFSGQLRSTREIGSVFLTEDFPVTAPQSPSMSPVFGDYRFLYLIRYSLYGRFPARLENRIDEHGRSLQSCEDLRRWDESG